MKQVRAAKMFEESTAPEIREAAAMVSTPSKPSRRQTVAQMQELIAAYELERAENQQKLEQAARELAKKERIIARQERQNRKLQTANHARVRELSEVQQRSFTDPLTGVFNKAGLTHVMGKLTEPHVDRRYHVNNHVIMMIDLNGFKQINDTHGHLAGDRALVVVAEALRSQVRTEDIVARPGGDEFVLILNNMTEEDMHKKMADINAMFAQLSFRWGAETNIIPVRGSVGSWAVDYNMTAEENIEQADKMMYRQKQIDKLGLDVVFA